MSSPSISRYESQQALRRQSMHPSAAVAQFIPAELQQPLPARFAAVVAQHGDRLAVKGAMLALTFAELDHASNQVGQALLARQGPGSEPVVTLMERDVWRHVAHWGILKAGKCYVPLPLSTPPERLDFILADLGQPPVLTDTASGTRIQWPAGYRDPQAIVVEEMLQNAPGHPLSPHIPIDAPCLIRYTSGSTGRPKGVVSSHFDQMHEVIKGAHINALCHLDWIACIGSDHTHHVRSLLVGASYLEVNLQTHGMPAVLNTLRRHPVTVLICTVTGFRQLVRTAGSSLVLPQLRTVVLLGEPPTPQDITAAHGIVAPQCVFSNQYGTTEAYIAAAYYATADSAAQLDTLPAGYPVPGCEILLLDEDGAPAQAHEVGEIAVRSRYLTRGYWGQPELTAQRYVPDPEGSDKRMYLTGDLGRMDPDGCLHYVGRKDFQVKIRSHRILLTEVEDLLRAAPGIKDAAVVARPGPNGDLRLIAYIVADADKPAVSQLRQVVARSLPVSPAHYVFLDELPLTTSHKVDRLALPDPGRQRPSLDSPYVSPRTPVEAHLATIWAEVLGLDQAGIHDNFLDLGGDSLLASQVVTRVMCALSMDLPLSALYAAPTVAEMALAITQASATALSSAEIEHMLVEVEDGAELTAWPREGAQHDQAETDGDPN